MSWAFEDRMSCLDCSVGKEFPGLVDPGRDLYGDQIGLNHRMLVNGHKQV